MLNPDLTPRPCLYIHGLKTTDRGCATLYRAARRKRKYVNGDVGYLNIMTQRCVKCEFGKMCAEGK